MLKQTSLFVAGVALCVSSWANIIGTYQCSMMHHDKLRTGEITISEADKTYSFMMKWDDKPKVVKNELKPTSSDSRFLSAWTSDRAVGISEWMFDKDSLKIEYVKHKIDKLGKHVGTINCMMKK